MQIMLIYFTLCYLMLTWRSALFFLPPLARADKSNTGVSVQNVLGNAGEKLTSFRKYSVVLLIAFHFRVTRCHVLNDPAQKLT
ncbi:hypothetical protein GJAV_G00118120 [Gymnothorax javanicus]|nr:hypothetical protein GJAV_G00118120 [Gymnothorax javanicus]